MKFYPSKDLHERLHTIRQGLFEKAKTYLNSLYSDMEENKPYVRVYLELYYNNKRLDDMYNHDIEGFVLKDEKPAVYRIIRKRGRKNIKEIVVIGRWDVEEIVYGNNKDFLGISNDTYTFYTYRDFLKFVDASLREEGEPVGGAHVSLTDKNRVFLYSGCWRKIC